MIKTKDLIIIGDSAFAQIAYEYFNEDSIYNVVAFAVEREYLKQETCMGLKVYTLDELSQLFDYKDTSFFVAVTYGKLNRTRRRLKERMEELGFSAASYISSRSYIASSSKIGPHCFIFEDNTIQSFSELKSNVILWSGNHIGHHSIVEDNVFISSHVVISGFCKVGKNSFVGVNSTVGNNVEIGEDNWIEPGSIITKSTSEQSIVKSVKSEISNVKSLKFSNKD